MKSLVIGLVLGGTALALSACAGMVGVGVVAGPAEAVVAEEAGYESYFMQGLQYVGDAACSLGNGSGKWSPDNGGECVE